MVVAKGIPEGAAGRDGRRADPGVEDVQRRVASGGAVVTQAGLRDAEGPALGHAVWVIDVSDAGKRVTERVRRRRSGAEFRVRPVGVVHLEGEREVYLESPPERVGVDAARPEGGLRGETSHDGGRVGLDDATAVGEQRELLHMRDARVDTTEGHGREAWQDFVS